MHQLSMLQTDGGHDIHRQLGLSGEPLIPGLQAVLAPKDPMTIVEYQDLVLEGRAFQEAYLDYLNSTGGANGSNNISSYSSFSLIRYFQASL